MMQQLKKNDIVRMQSACIVFVYTKREHNVKE